MLVQEFTEMIANDTDINLSARQISSIRHAVFAPAKSTTEQEPKSSCSEDKVTPETHHYHPATGKYHRNSDGEPAGTPVRAEDESETDADTIWCPTCGEPDNMSSRADRAEDENDRLKTDNKALRSMLQTIINVDVLHHDDVWKPLIKNILALLNNTETHDGHVKPLCRSRQRV